MRFTPAGRIQNGDGLLTVLADDGGLTESVAKRIPIIVRKLQFSLFRGRTADRGPAGRVALRSQDAAWQAKPISADASSMITARWSRSFDWRARDGLGRFDSPPEPAAATTLDRKARRGQRKVHPAAAGSRGLQPAQLR